jgi:hypothetical protein
MLDAVPNERAMKSLLRLEDPLRMKRAHREASEIKRVQQHADTMPKRVDAKVRRRAITQIGTECQRGAPPVAWSLRTHCVISAHCVGQSGRASSARPRCSEQPSRTASVCLPMPTALYESMTAGIDSCPAQFGLARVVLFHVCELGLFEWQFFAVFDDCSIRRI